MLAGMISTYHHAQVFSIEMGTCDRFCLDCPGTAVLPISASQIARMIGVSHCTQLLVDMGLANSLPRLTLNQNPRDLEQPSELSLPAFLRYSKRGDSKVWSPDPTEEVGRKSSKTSLCLVRIIKRCTLGLEAWLK
jgi:hypothetical protein